MTRHGGLGGRVVIWLFVYLLVLLVALVAVNVLLMRQVSRERRDERTRHAHRRDGSGGGPLQ